MNFFDTAFNHPPEFDIRNTNLFSGKSIKNILPNINQENFSPVKYTYKKMSNLIQNSVDKSTINLNLKSRPHRACSKKILTPLISHFETKIIKIKKEKISLNEIEINEFNNPTKTKKHFRKIGILKEIDHQKELLFDKCEKKQISRNFCKNFNFYIRFRTRV